MIMNIEEGVFVVKAVKTKNEEKELVGFFDKDHIDGIVEKYIIGKPNYCSTGFYMTPDNHQFCIIFGDYKRQGELPMTMLVSPSVVGNDNGLIIKGNIIVANTYNEATNKVVPLDKYEVKELMNYFAPDEDDRKLLLGNINDFGVEYII